MPHKDPEKRRAYDKAWCEANKERKAATRTAWNRANPELASRGRRAWREANLEKRRAYAKAWVAAHSAERRAYDMAKYPDRYRKAYDPNCRPFPATLDLASGEWVRCEQTLLPAPDTSLAVRVAAAILIIEGRLAEGEWAAS